MKIGYRIQDKLIPSESNIKFTRISNLWGEYNVTIPEPGFIKYFCYNYLNLYHNCELLKKSIICYNSDLEGYKYTCRLQVTYNSTSGSINIVEHEKSEETAYYLCYDNGLDIYDKNGDKIVNFLCKGNTYCCGSFIVNSHIYKDISQEDFVELLNIGFYFNNRMGKQKGNNFMAYNTTMIMENKHADLLPDYFIKLSKNKTHTILTNYNGYNRNKKPR